MCGRCRCWRVCGCNTSCCCWVSIPIGAGYVVCSLWLMLNGGAFPAMSFLFWPKDHIFYGCCSVCGVNVMLVLVSLTNMRFRVHELFSFVLYGVLVSYLAGGLMIAVSIGLDVSGNSALLMSSFRRHFGISIHPSSTFRTLQTIQIMFYAYLFASYVYCGFVLQLYEISHDKRYKKREPKRSGMGNFRKSHHELSRA